MSHITNHFIPPPYVGNITNSQTFSVPPPVQDYGFPPVPEMLQPVPPPPVPLLAPSQFLSPSPICSNIPPWHQLNVQQPYDYCVMTPQNVLTSVMQKNPVESEVHEGNVSEDQKWVQSWLKQIDKSTDITGKNIANSDIKIHEIKEILSAIISVIKELENASVKLNVMMKSVTDEEWENKCLEINRKKEELSLLLCALKMDPMKMKEIKKMLKKREAKRDRLRRQSLKRKAEKKVSKENTEKLHQQIDSWLGEMKESVERSKREEELKREADSVLWEVTQKKAEARKQISLLTSLLQLRDAKAVALRSSGKYVSEIEVTAFNTVIEKLKTMWEHQLKGYLLEEQGLRVMLTEDVKKKDTCGIHIRQVLQEWETAIFGNKCNDTFGEPRDLWEFLEVRQAWDHFVVNEKTAMASTIPVGWVLPTKPSNENWEKCLKNAK